MTRRLLEVYLIELILTPVKKAKNPSGILASPRVSLSKEEVPGDWDHVLEHEAPNLAGSPLAFASLPDVLCSQPFVEKHWPDSEWLSSS